MPEIVDIPLADLLVDTKNARLKDEQSNQQNALLAIAKLEGPRLLKLAEDLVESGMDPMTLIGVVGTDDRKKRYRVVEGNRRIVALKGLDTPNLLLPALNSAQQKKWGQLAHRYATNPINTIRCVLFADEQEAHHWIEIRHTGQNDGIGLVEWGSDEKDRFLSRNGKRSPEGQVIDFVEKFGLLSEAAKNSDKSIITNVQRILSSPIARKALGIEVTRDGVVSWYPTDEVGKGLGRIIDDLKTETVNVRDLYHAADREKYIKSLSADSLPDPGTRLDNPRLLSELNSEPVKSAQPSKPAPKPKSKPPYVRTALIPKTCILDIDHPRINNIYNELLSMSVDQTPNACSVLMRVFVELSVDHYLERELGLTVGKDRMHKLSWKLKEAAADLKKKGKITALLETAVIKIAEQEFTLAATITSFHSYVHNAYIFPKPTELRTAWDEIQPFMEKLFAK